MLDWLDLVAATCTGLAVIGGESAALTVAIALVITLVALAAYEGSRLPGGWAMR